MDIGITENSFLCFSFFKI